jgi:ribosome recycling factor
MILEDKKEQFEKVISFLKGELAKLRTGRANPAIIEDLKVEYYGAPTPIKQLGSIHVPEPRQLVIQPWDKNAALAIEKAILEANLGFNPVNEGDKIRITLPELTGERRKELVKVANRVAEEARVQVRNIREEIWKEIKKSQEAGKISEDDKFRLQEKLQELIDDYNQTIKQLAEAKEKEIVTL